MAWWSWMMLGLFLLASELLVVDVAFYLVFIGFAAIVVGIVGLLGLTLEPTAQWLLFSALAIISMVLFRRRVYDRLRGSTPDYGDGLAGTPIIIESTLEPGKSCRQQFRGTQWTIVNRGNVTIEPNSEVMIDTTEGLTIVLAPQGNQE